MKRVLSLILAVLLAALPLSSCERERTEEPVPAESAAETLPAEETGTPDDGMFAISDDELRDRILGGWIGSMIGVAWAGPTEFRWCRRIIPEDEMPEWHSSAINDAFGQDDLYVEIPFMDAMEEHGVLCGVEQLAEKFRDSAFPLWHANLQGRENLRNGLLPPDSGSYVCNVHADDIDWQIECDFLGIMYPALVNAAAQRSFEIGHIMNYGDGVYGGVFLAAMHAAAYRASSVAEIVEDGLAVIPENTRFRALIEDVLDSYRRGDSWEENWQMLEDRWADDDKCPECAGDLNIDAKLNSGYVAIGLLYGNGDLGETIRISTRCGQDSDCNPSSAASILGSWLGASRIDEIYTKDLDWDGRKFSNTEYTFRHVMELALGQTREVLTLSGAVCESGEWRIPLDAEAVPVPYEQWPDGISANLDVKSGADRSVSVRLSVFEFGEKLDSVRLDMGDGFVCDVQPVVYTYAEPGEYTVRCEVRGASGSEIALERTVTARETAALSGHAVCTVMNPKGGGNPDPEIMRDGVIPEVGNADSSLQYDTYDGGAKKDFLFAGVTFDMEATLTGVHFTEGKHFWDGGWFNGEPKVEIYEGGAWKVAKAAIDRPYPGNSESEQGPSFETYEFTFPEPIRCSGVRLAGKPGGSASFVSVGEISPVVLEIHGEASETRGEDTILVCSVASPTGGGAKDLRVICDGVKPDAARANDSMQYDTYHGRSGPEEAYVGFLYHTPQTVTEIAFTEGNHFWDGGWFRDGAPAVEVWKDGAWVRCACEVTPAYPVSDARDSFGKGYETYTFRLSEPTECGGVRLIGTAGGEHGFISISEIEVR